MVIFHCYVKLPEGINKRSLNPPIPDDPRCFFAPHVHQGPGHPAMPRSHGAGRRHHGLRQGGAVADGAALAAAVPGCFPMGQITMDYGLMVV